MSDPVESLKPWRQPTIKEIARVARVGTATVDRVLNTRGGVRESTRKKVFDAIDLLTRSPQGSDLGKPREIAVLCDSGISFNKALENALGRCRAIPSSMKCTYTAIETKAVEPVRFAQLIERQAAHASGLVIVAREELMINRAVKAVSLRGVPVVCITTDLPNSKRLAYVGSDQVSAGATAAYLMGRTLGERSGQVLVVSSAPFRCQEERELGFRRVVRNHFSNLNVVERVNSNDETEHTIRSIRAHLAEHQAPIGIYNVAGGNLGIALALEEAGLKGKVIFIGHELNTNSRMLLETDGMDFVIGHDLDRELELGLGLIQAHLERRALPEINPSRILIFTKYNCN